MPKNTFKSARHSELKSSKSTSKTWIWIVGGILLIFLVIGGLFLNKSSVQDNQSVPPTLTQPVKTGFSVSTELAQTMSQQNIDEIKVRLKSKPQNIGCIKIVQVIARDGYTGVSNWNEKRPCADVQIIIPKNPIQPVRLAIIDKEYNTLQVLNWTFGSNGIPESSNPQYNILIDGLAITLLSPDEQQLLLPEGWKLGTISWDSISYPSNSILQWINTLSEWPQQVIYKGGVSSYYR